MTWFFIALLSCAASCTSIELVRKARLDGLEILMYRAILVVLMLLPFFAYMKWPHDPGFYALMAVSSCIYAWGSITITNLAKQKCSRVAAMVQPLVIFTTFSLWLVISPLDRVELQANPNTLALTLFCFAVLVGALHFIRRNDYAWGAFMTVAPVAIGYAALNVAQKWFIDTPEGGWGLILSIIILGNFGMLVALPFLKRYRVRSDELAITHGGAFPVATLLIVAVLHIVNWGGLMHAMEIAENPAYPVAIMALAPVLFQIYYWIRGFRDNASPLAGTAMTASALFLGLLHL
jgi:hypothetical protein